MNGMDWCCTPSIMKENKLFPLYCTRKYLVILTWVVPLDFTADQLGLFQVLYYIIHTQPGPAKVRRPPLLAAKARSHKDTTTGGISAKVKHGVQMTETNSVTSS